MSSRPRDTSHDAWEQHRSALARLGPQGRFRVALELSESVRSIQLAGLQSRNPGWDEPEAVRHFVARQHGIDLPTQS